MLSGGCDQLGNERDHLESARGHLHLSQFLGHDGILTWAEEADRRYVASGVRM